MIVDDEPNPLEKLSNYVHQADLGFHVVAKAQGAEDALFYLGMAKPDLVITDIRMPVIDSLTLLELMQEAGWKGYKAIVSGYDDFAYAQQAIRLGVIEYLLKPIFPEDVKALLERVQRHFDQEQVKVSRLRSEIQAEFNGSQQTNEVDILPSYIVQAKAYIKEHFAECITLSQVAKIVSVNPAYLSSRFAKHCGQNFLEYVTHYRIAKAKELLVQTCMQVQEVANHVGYTDIAYFNRVFRRETGLTPSCYRSNNRK